MAKTAELDLQLRVPEALERAQVQPLDRRPDRPLSRRRSRRDRKRNRVSAESGWNPACAATRRPSLDPDSLQRLRDRFADDPRVEVKAVDLEDAPDSDHSAVVALNVLEHIADDSGRCGEPSASSDRAGGS